MTDNIGMAAQLAGQSLRFGWYFALNRVLDWRTSQLKETVEVPLYKPQRPVPSLQELLAELGQLIMSDALNVREGLYPAMDDDGGSLPRHLARVQAMLADIPRAHVRRAGKQTGTVKATPAAAGVPAYYAQDFHFQAGGYLTEGSARLYDVQVETLFMGAAGPMRRTILAPIAHDMAGRDQRQVTLLDVACGTGRFLRQVRLTYPAMQLKGLDLSRPYLDEAGRQLKGLRPVELIEAAAEKMPLADASIDIVTSIFLFHELPPEVRRAVVAEMARVLKPGGMLVLLDSLQMGDKPGWDGLVEAFPERFHEPYYRHYAIDDLDGLFSAAGLEPELTTTPFLSKLMVRRKR
ncbi:MAG TPA: class I SAM-dependent methyltransferase [Hyphomicrobiaceae bacterium]|nr:class I SAM-dependent methyltransferase [Hyphomicrobiaceae bacterium]